MMGEQRPPFGLRPEFVHDTEQNLKRISEIFAAIARYAEDGKPIPAEWYEELMRRAPPVDPMDGWDGGRR